MKKFFTMILTLLILISVTGCGNEDTPQAALEDMQTALSERDEKKLLERVDLDKFFGDTYDEVTLELAKNYDEYTAKYPNDPYFQHDAEFLKKYNAEYRELHLKFLRGVQDAYFARMPEPDEPEDDPYAYVAHEFEAMRLASDATITDTKIDGDKALMTVSLQGNHSLRGEFIGQITFNLRFEKNDKGKWQFTKIENLDELTPPLLEKAELVWITFFNA